jgi:hypothetical protein
MGLLQGVRASCPLMAVWQRWRNAGFVMRNRLILNALQRFQGRFHGLPNVRQNAPKCPKKAQSGVSKV